MTSWFILGNILGAKVDGAVLGFSAAIWAAWDNEVLQQRRRRKVAKRRHNIRRADLTPDREPTPDKSEGSEEEDRDYFSDYQDGDR